MTSPDWTSATLDGAMPPQAAYLGGSYEAILADMWHSEPVLRRSPITAPACGLPLPRPAATETKDLPPTPAGGKSAWTLLPSLLDPRTRTKRGVARIPLYTVPWNSFWHGSTPRPSSDSLGLYYEVHGRGPVHICLIMGLNMSHVGWLNQVEFFMQHPDVYSVLVLDNRGWGNSEVPSGRYTTQLMAQDLLLLLSSPEIGWLPPPPSNPAESFVFSPATHKIHFAGVSMGGMILLELLRITLRDGQSTVAASATLVSTTSGHAVRAADVELSELAHLGTDQTHAVKRFSTGLPPLPGVRALSETIMRGMLGHDTPQKRVERMNKILFPREWLKHVPSDNVIQANQTLRKRGWAEEKLWHGPRNDEKNVSNEEHWLRASLWRAAVFARLQPAPDGTAALAAISATLTHQVKTSALQAIDAALSADVPRLTVVSGTFDNLVNIHNSSHLVAVMPHAKPVWIQNAGHALPVQCADQLNGALWETIERTQSASGLESLPPPAFGSK